MGVKKFVRRGRMTKTKTLNVREDVHRRVRLAAATAGVKISDYAEALIEIGLRREKDTMRLLAERTSQAQPPESSK